MTEACEYTNSFLSFFPKIDIILNIEEDHLDFFKDLDDIRHSFGEFARLVPDDGSIIINAGITDHQEICKGAAGSIITFSDDPEKQADYSCLDITYDEHGCGSYVLLIRGEEAGRITLSVPGRHNVLNSLAAIAAAKTLGVSDDSISAGLKRFTGTDRRFEYKGSIGGVTIIDDYAHHPTEIRATLAAAENYPHNRLWCVFQPHTYSRTKSLFSEFVEALSLADHVILADIYAAREQDTLGMSSQLLMEEINRKTGDNRARYFNSFDRIEAFLLAECAEGDLILTMGAGDIHKVGETILGKN